MPLDSLMGQSEKEAEWSFFRSCGFTCSLLVLGVPSFGGRPGAKVLQQMTLQGSCPKPAVCMAGLDSRLC